MRLRALEGFCNVRDEIIISLVSAHDIGFKPAFFNKALRHQRFAKSRVPIQQDALWQLRAEFFVNSSVLHHITELQEFLFDRAITDNLFKCVCFHVLRSPFFSIHLLIV